MDKGTLKKIAEILNENHISWGLGASSMLYFHGLVDKPRDIDIMVDEADAPSAIELLRSVAENIQTDDGKGKYATKYFFEMTIDGQAVDMIGGYRILRQGWIYDFPVLKTLNLSSAQVDGTLIPLTHIEDWYVAYQIMGDPKGRVDAIEAYSIKNGGFKHADQIRKATEQILKKAPEEKALIERLQKWID